MDEEKAVEQMAVENFEQTELTWKPLNETTFFVHLY
jgi:hypothetical protein